MRVTMAPIWIPSAVALAWSVEGVGGRWMGVVFRLVFQLLSEMAMPLLDTIQVPTGKRAWERVRVQVVPVKFRAGTGAMGMRSVEELGGGEIICWFGG